MLLPVVIITWKTLTILRFNLYFM